MAAQETSRSGALLERLREQIRKLEAQPRQVLMALRTGVAEVDELGVFRLGAGVELCGEEASGRTTLALSAVAAATREKRLAAWVDGPQELYPPAAAALGVELSRLLIARPRAPGQLVWTAVQLLRSGAFVCVVLDVTHTGVRLSMTDTKKLIDAARAGGSLLVLVTSETAPAPGLVRLMMRAVAAPRLHVVDESPQGEAFSVETSHGRRLSVPRTHPMRARRAERPWARPWMPRVEPATSLQRPKKNMVRDGRPHSSLSGVEGPLRTHSSPHSSLSGVEGPLRTHSFPHSSLSGVEGPLRTHSSPHSSLSGVEGRTWLKGRNFR